MVFTANGEYYYFIYELLLNQQFIMMYERYRLFRYRDRIFFGLRVCGKWLYYFTLFDLLEISLPNYIR